LVLYDVTTLYFEIDEGDGFREPGFSKERRLEPQITVGLLTDVRWVPAAGPRVRRQHRRDEDNPAGEQLYCLSWGRFALSMSLLLMFAALNHPDWRILHGKRKSSIRRVAPSRVQ
jgi:hypothetical protein